MGRSIDAGDLRKVYEGLEKNTGKLLGVLRNVHEENQRVSAIITEDYEAKLADVCRQYEERIAEQQFRIDGYEEENRRVAELLQMRMLYRLASSVRGGMGGPWVGGTLNEVVSLIRVTGETYEMEKLNAKD